MSLFPFKSYNIRRKKMLHLKGNVRVKIRRLLFNHGNSNSIEIVTTVYINFRLYITS